MSEDLTKVFKDRVLKSAQEHSGKVNGIEVLNDVFSLSMSMNLDEIECMFESSLLKIDDELFTLELSMEVEGITKLYFWIGEEIGLYSVFAINEKIECDGFAMELKKQFYGYEKILEVGYGSFTHKENQLDNLGESYLSWLTALEKGEVSLETVFNKSSGATLKNNIKQILIGASKDVGEMPSIIIVYKFDNAK